MIKRIRQVARPECGCCIATSLRSGRCPSNNNLAGCYEDQSLTLVVDRSASCCASASGHAQYSEPDHDNQKSVAPFEAACAINLNVGYRFIALHQAFFVFETWLLGRDAAFMSNPAVQTQRLCVDASCCYGRAGRAMVRSVETPLRSVFHYPNLDSISASLPGASRARSMAPTSERSKASSDRP